MSISIGSFSTLLFSILMRYTEKIYIDNFFLTFFKDFITSVDRIDLDCVLDEFLAINFHDL